MELGVANTLTCCQGRNHRTETRDVPSTNNTIEDDENGAEEPDLPPLGNALIIPEVDVVVGDLSRDEDRPAMGCLDILLGGGGGIRHAGRGPLLIGRQRLSLKTVPHFTTAEADGIGSGTARKKESPERGPVLYNSPLLTGKKSAILWRNGESRAPLLRSTCTVMLMWIWVSPSTGHPKKAKSVLTDHSGQRTPKNAR